MGKKSKGQLTEGADQMSGRLEELARVIKGWRHLASDVRVDGDRVAALLGEAGGRLVFVHHILGSKEEVIRATLRCVSSAPFEAKRLAAQFSVDEAAAPLVAVVTEGKTQGLLKQLSALCPEPLVLLAERRLTTAEGDKRFLEVLTPALAVTPAPLEVAGFPKERGAQLSALHLEEFAARVDRIDPELERSARADGLFWSWDGQNLCSIEQGPEGQLVGRIGEDGVPHELRPDQSIEIFLDWVLARHLELLEPVKAEALREVELMPHSSEPLLTPEEIAAFQE